MCTRDSVGCHHLVKEGFSIYHVPSASTFSLGFYLMNDISFIVLVMLATDMTFVVRPMLRPRRFFPDYYLVVVLRSGNVCRHALQITPRENNAGVLLKKIRNISCSVI